MTRLTLIGITSLLIIVSALFVLNISAYAGPLYRETFDNPRYQEIFNDKGHKLIGGLTSVCGLKLTGDPSPTSGFFASGTLFTLDGGYPSLIWNYYDPSTEKYSITGFADNEGLKYPRGVAANTTGNIYIADTGNHRIIRLKGYFGSQGLRADKVRNFGRLGRGDGEFVSPFDVDICKSNNHLFVSDYGNSRIQEFDENGEFIQIIGQYGNAQGQFINQKGIMVDPGGYLLVADTGNVRIQTFKTIGGIYQFDKELKPTGDIPPDAEFCDVVLTESGAIYIADEKYNQIYLFDSNYNYLKTYIGNPGDPFRSLRGASVPAPEGSNYFPNTMVTVEKDRLQAFILGMEALDVRAEPSYFYPLAPENNSTTFKYTLTEHGLIQLYVLDNRNMVVRTLATDQLRSMGYNQEIWDGKDNAGNYVPPGTYTFQLNAYDNNANGHAVRWDYKYFPITIHDPPVITISSIAPKVIATDTTSQISYTLSKPGIVKMEVLNSNNVSVYSIQGPAAVGNNLAYWSGRDNYNQIPLDGYYTIRLQAQDEQGYWGLSKTIQVALANTPPQTSLTMPQNNTYGLDARINGSISGFLLASYRLEYQHNGNWWPLAEKNVTTDQITGELAAWNTKDLNTDENTYYLIRLTAKNQAGVESTPITMNVLVDNIAPRIITHSLFPQYISPLGATGSTQNATSISCQIEEQNHFENKLEFIDNLAAVRKMINLDLDNDTQTKTWDGNDETGVNVNDGLVICRLKATDRGGNTTIKDIQVVIDTNRYPENIAILSSRQIVGQTENNYKISWTPDNKQIVYSFKEGDFTNIYLRNSDGTGSPIRLTNYNASPIFTATRPEISNDGKKYLYDTHDSIYIYYLNSGVMDRQINGYWYGSWSPDGSKIASINYLNGLNRVFDNQGNFIADLSFGFCPSWAPDSKYLYYSTEAAPSSSSQIFLVDIQSGQVTGPIANGVNPEMSPDGNALVYLTPQFNLAVKTASGAVQNLITGNTRRYATWSPDGKQLAFTNLDGQTFVATLDRPDRYANLSAVLHMPLAGSEDILGTAADMNFLGYELSYATTENAAVWTVLRSSTTQVKESTLGDWNTSGLPVGDYWLKLHVWDKALNRKVILTKVNIGTLGPNLIFNLHANPAAFFPDVSGQDQTTINYTLYGAVSDLTLGVYNEAGTLIKNLNPPQDPGAPYPRTLSVAWNGKNNSNQIVDAETYTIKLQATGLGQPILKQSAVIVANGLPTAIILSPAMSGWSGGTITYEGQATGYEFEQYWLEVTGLGGSMMPQTRIAQSDFPVEQGELVKWEAPKSGQYFAQLTVRNKLGVENTASVFFTVDRTPPTTTLEVQSDSVEATGKIFVGLANQLVLSSAEPTAYSSGLKEIKVAVDGTWQTYTVPFSLATVGEHMVSYYAVDLMDNEEPVQTKQVVVNGLKPDTSVIINHPKYQPYSTIFVNGQTEFVVNAQETGADAVPIQEIHWGIAPPQRLKFPGDEYQVPSYQIYTIPLTLAEYAAQGISLYTRAVDATGNVGAWVQTGPLYVDITSPNLTLSWEGPDPMLDPVGIRYATSATMYLLTSEDLGSGLNRAEYQLVHEWGSDGWSDYAEGQKVILTANGGHEIQYRAFDQVGNSVSGQAYQVIIDNTPPEISIANIEEGGFYAASLVPEISILDAHLKNSEILLDGQPYNGDPIISIGSHLLHLQASDWSGNTSQQDMTFNIGEPTPTPTSTASPTDTQTETPTATVTPTPSATPTDTPTPTDTSTLTQTATETTTDTATVTDTPTDTATPTFTATPTDTDTVTATHTPTDTDTVTLTHTHTDTPSGTATASQTDTPSPTFTLTSTPTLTPTLSSTDTPIDTETVTPTLTATPSPTASATLVVPVLTPQHVRARVEGSFILSPGESRRLFGISVYRKEPQPNIPLRFRMIMGEGDLEGSNEKMVVTGPAGEPASVMFNSAETPKVDVNLVQVDNLGLGGRRYLLLLVISHGKHKDHKAGASTNAENATDFDTLEEAQAAADRLLGELGCVCNSPTVTVTRTPTIIPTVTPTQTPLPSVLIYNVDKGQVLPYPNPGRERIKFALRLEESASVSIEIYNMLGERVSAVQEHLNASPMGTAVEWICKNNAPGMYFAKITVTSERGIVILTRTVKVLVVH